MKESAVNRGRKEEGELRTKKLRARGLKFRFGGPPDCEAQEGPERHTCILCARRYGDHGVSVWLNGVKVGRLKFYVGVLCGECLTSSPKQLAELARKRAPILRRKPPDLEGMEDLYTKWADALLVAAGLLDTLDSLDAIPDGVLARKIGEAYRELDTRRKGKAA